MNATVSGSFRGLSTGVDYTLTANGSGTFRGYQVNGAVTITPSAVSIVANAYVPDIQATLGFTDTATVACTTACTMTYDVSADAAFLLNGLHAKGHFRLRSSKGMEAVIDVAGTKQNMGFSSHLDTILADGGMMFAAAAAAAAA